MTDGLDLLLPSPDVVGNLDALVVRLSALGDVVLTTGVLDHWHHQRDLRVAVLTRQALAPIFDHHPAVGAVIGLGEAQLRQQWGPLCVALARRFSGKILIDLHGSLRSLRLAAHWRGPRHRYPKFSWSRRLYRRWKLPWAEARLLAHNVPQRYALALDPTAPPMATVRPRLYLTEDERPAAQSLLAQRHLRRPGRPLVALHPYATHANKAWPQARWQELIQALEARGWDWLAVGRNDHPFLPGHHDLTNTTDLRTTAAVVAACDVLVSGDSGPMHLATAVGTPVVALFGPTTRAWGFAPSGERDVVLELPLACRPCSLHGGAACPMALQCLHALDAERVMAALEGAVAPST